MRSFSLLALRLKKKLTAGEKKMAGRLNKAMQRHERQGLARGVGVAVAGECLVAWWLEKQEVW